jgi:hypothetical protein
MQRFPQPQIVIFWLSIGQYSPGFINVCIWVHFGKTSALNILLNSKVRTVIIGDGKLQTQIVANWYKTVKYEEISEDPRGYDHNRRQQDNSPSGGFEQVHSISPKKQA